MKYVVGFMFDKDLQQVVLIQKLKPKWQNGFLNGVGGKVEIVRIISLHWLPASSTIPNLQWLIPLAKEIITGGLNTSISELPIKVFYSK